MTKKELRRDIKDILRHSFTYSEDINEVCEAIISEVQERLKGYPSPCYRDLVCSVQGVMYCRICG